MLIRVVLGCYRVVNRKEAVIARATALRVDKMLVLVVLAVVLGKV